MDSRRALSCASGVAVVAIAAHLLIGCTAVDKIAARFGDDGELEFAVCATLDINRIEVRQERASETEAVNELWVATGEHALDDERLAYGQPPAGMANEFDPVTSLPARFVFYAERDDADGSVLDATPVEFVESKIAYQGLLLTGVGPGSRLVFQPSMPARVLPTFPTGDRLRDLRDRIMRQQHPSTEDEAW